MGRRTLPPAPAGSGAVRETRLQIAEPCAELHAWSLDDYLAELTRRMQESSATTCSASTPAAPTRSAPTSTGAATSTSPRSSPARSRHETKQRLVDALRHEALPCPARGLELVVYPLATAQSGGGEPGFELNLNTGATHGFRVDEAPGDIEGFWFAIDRSILREHGVAAARPAGRASCSRRSRASTLAAAARRVGALAPRLRHADSADVVLNTARTQHFVDTGHWISKPAARKLLDQAGDAP